MATGFERLEVQGVFSEASDYTDPIADTLKRVWEAEPEGARVWLRSTIVAAAATFIRKATQGPMTSIHTLVVYNKDPDEYVQIGYFDAANGPAGTAITTHYVKPGGLFITNDVYITDQNATIQVIAAGTGPCECLIYLSYS